MQVVQKMDRHLEVYREYYAHGLLDPQKHRHLVADLERFSAEAGIPPSYVYKKGFSAFEDKGDVEWLKHFRTHIKDGGKLGLLYENQPNVVDRMAAMTGVFLRNFVNARMLSVLELLELLRSGEAPENTVLLVPDFWDGNEKTLQDWQASLLGSYLITRCKNGLSTVLGVKQVDVGFKKKFGEVFIDLITAHFQIIE